MVPLAHAAADAALLAVSALPYPQIDPIALEIGPLVIRWYALAYLFGVLSGWGIAVWLAKQPGSKFTVADANDFPTFILLGLIVGGRLGYVLFYKPAYYFFEAPHEIPAIWHGGMSFHGGLIGILLFTLLFCRRRKIPLAVMTDLVVLVSPIGLFLGRMANFINGELWGRPTGHWIGMVFPADPTHLPRHPSQLYEAFAEGILLFIVMWVLRATVAKTRNDGFLSGAFLIGYGIARSSCEFFREPDAHLGFIAGGVTMGQILSIPLIIAGIVVIVRAGRRDPIAASAAATEPAATAGEGTSAEP
jgi:phosphatidylglycerol---prolipoprotein diacylglyceryl transferase